MRQTITKAFFALPFFLCACAIKTDRSGYEYAWFYERLRPYYESNLALKPRVYLRAVAELVGYPVTLPDGSEAHWDVLREDIELFFARSVADEEERLELARVAIGTACPQTDLENIEDNVAHSSDTYLVLEGVPCLGYAE